MMFWWNDLTGAASRQRTYYVCGLIRGKQLVSGVIVLRYCIAVRFRMAADQRERCGLTGYV